MTADQNEYGPFNSEREALDTRAAAVLKAAYDEHPGVGAGNQERADLLTAACEAAGVVLGDYDLRLLRWLANWENGQCVSLAGIIRRAYEAGKAAALRGGTPLTVQPDAVCGGYVIDPNDNEFAYDCGNHSCFLVERSDGDKSFGENGGSTEACAAPLADAGAGMIDGDENIRAVVSIRWSTPEETKEGNG